MDDDEACRSYVCPQCTFINKPDVTHCEVCCCSSINQRIIDRSRAISTDSKYSAHTSSLLVCLLSTEVVMRCETGTFGHDCVLQIWRRVLYLFATPRVNLFSLCTVSCKKVSPIKLWHFLSNFNAFLVAMNRYSTRPAIASDFSGSLPFL